MVSKWMDGWLAMDGPAKLLLLTIHDTLGGGMRSKVVQNGLHTGGIKMLTD